MAKEKANETALATVADVQNIVIGVNTDVSGLTLEERATLLQRWSEARAAEKIEDDLIDVEHVVTGMTLYEVDFLDQETGEIGLATYVAFEMDGGRAFKTASAYAAGFAKAVANLLGYDPQSGKLPHHIKMKIQLAKAATGYKYNFVFKGLA